ncbi:MAG: 1-(5-phosphoribosyl)-5-[(5-phosphoribosylamino)methylideneamino]imidazole-4-carboxamide isomerase [Clostridia bacterium]|nr:1-(5-phosphoribosyl)-5-[(5-phosphoribosylamino)methylideneamino]imidazole-4-carboxamide isomerase [Clostridia bacterium]
MFIYPAIDVIGGKVVRLTRGDYDSAKSYSLTPVQAALSFKAEGASHVHVVDLDGAKSGKAENVQAVKDIILSSGACVEVGGGVRSQSQIEEYLSAGADRVILGTVAVRDFNFVKLAVKKYGKKIAVGVDAAEGKVAVSGWREVTDIDALGFCRKLYDEGVESVIYTDISRDGTLSGTNLKVYKKLLKIEGLKVTASGGITYLDEIRALKEMGVYAAVLGKALYEGKLSLKQAVRIAEGK